MRRAEGRVAAVQLIHGRDTRKEIGRRKEAPWPSSLQKRQNNIVEVKVDMDYFFSVFIYMYIYPVNDCNV